MSVKTAHTLDDTFYFCTLTCNRWLPLFQITNFYDEIYKWFSILESSSCWINGYVIMPNHLHVIIYTPRGSKPLNTLVSNGKRFMAYDIVARLKKLGRHDLLIMLAEDVRPSDLKAGKLHQVFKDSFDAREIRSEKMMIQKLNYMHTNPVSKKWMLARDQVSYIHSSARFYETGNHGPFIVKHYKDL